MNTLRGARLLRAGLWVGLVALHLLAVERGVKAAVIEMCGAYDRATGDTCG